MSILDPEHTPVPRHDVIALVSGLLVFVASFLPWYGVTFEGPAETGLTGSVNAWHGLAGVGLLLLLFSLVVTAGESYLGEDVSRLPVSVAAAALACGGALCVVIKSLSLPEVDVPGASVGLRWGGWILLVLVVVQALLSVLRVVHSGDAKPDAR